MFSPPKDYRYETEKIALKDFFDFEDRFILRPPYQRKANIWSTQKRQSFLDSLCRGHYVPPLVLRKVRMSQDKFRWEVIDGQQRISTVVLFFTNQIELPKSLRDMASGALLVGKTYEKLPVEQKQWFSKLYLEADIIDNIEDKTKGEHLRKASDIFWRLQLGEPLKFMEVQHAHVYSGVRNFVTKYADDTSFDYEKYEFLATNSNRHPFFGKIVSMKNNRMQHLLLLSRLLLLERAGGPTDLGKDAVESLFQTHGVSSVADFSFEGTNEARRCLRVLNKFHDIFRDDVTVKAGGTVPELKIEYFIVSLYLLLRHLDEYYAFERDKYIVFREFVGAFYQRWARPREEDREILLFEAHRRQTKEEVATRDLITRAVFFERKPDLLLKDTKRRFDEAQRIVIYRRDKGLCQTCLAEGKSEQEALVSWIDYNADHIVAHIKGGSTLEENAQVLCKRHNVQKGSK